ncbi:MAG TPA: efflux RND transporter periplasmic adaptor subunit [Bryobacteraceae bacterium]|jgi:multidrug efflux pump subunit AcrA (membrane-fusion protein)|nr:efflux RND transporter periplasmic adaptor subunit [Bryobacteraceae bacterium]
MSETGRPKRGRHISTIGWALIVLVVIGFVLLVVFLGWLPRRQREREIAERQKQQAQQIPQIEATKVEPSRSISELKVPGTTQPLIEAYIYARSSGYLSKRLVDIGDHVSKGQLLAMIDAPDFDQQVAQARSTLQQSENNLRQLEAQLALATVTWDRYKVLVAKGVFSRQDGDTQQANYRVAQANVEAERNTVQAAQANLDRLIVLQQYERVTAPFDGIITQRNVDVGALITAQGTGAGSSSINLGGTTIPGQADAAGTAGTPPNLASPPTGGDQGGTLFEIAAIDRLRILVSVPEAYAGAIRAGQRAVLEFNDPSRQVIGQVTRTAGAINQNTRTLLVEVQVTNSRRQLMPGMFTMVGFEDASTQHPITIPGDSIAVRNAKNVVALIRDDKVHFQVIEVGRDYGDETEILSGLHPGDIIANTISDEITEGARVQPKIASKTTPSQSSQANPKPPGEGQYGNQGLTNRASTPKGGKKGNK